MTDEMLAEANANKARLGVTNVEFLKGHIEQIPLPDNSVDVVISNCVINLSVDKDAVFREIHRVLKPGGRMAVSDIVTLKPLPEWLRKNLAVWTGCIAGALSVEEFKSKLQAAGFAELSVELTRVYDPDDLGFDPTDTKDTIGSAFIRAQKAKQFLQPGGDYLIRPAQPADFVPIHELLTAAHLPVAGVDAATGGYVVADFDGKVAGVLGMEKFGTSALLRSFTVRSAYRKRGVGEALVRHVLDQLKQEGISPIYILTNTAEAFAARFGFVKISREEIPAPILAGSAIGTACPASSTCMKLD